MNPVIIGNATLYHGDCIDLLRTLSDDSIEACLTDPPYGLSNHTESDIRACMSAWLAGKPYQHGKAGFMGRMWDSFVPGPEMWKELYRVLKPGAHLLVFAGTRTADLMSMALRLAGFEARDCVMWTFGSGFPKAANISKGIQSIQKFGSSSRHAGRLAAMEDSYTPSESVGTCMNGTERAMGGGRTNHPPKIENPTSEAIQWDGWFSHIKPAYEPILLFRKPLDGTIAENTLKWGCGGLNIAACRVEGIKPECKNIPRASWRRMEGRTDIPESTPQVYNHTEGRYPSNLIVSSDEEVEKCFPGARSSGIFNAQDHGINPNQWATNFGGKGTPATMYNDFGSASRFFQHCDYSVEEIAEMNGIELKRIVYSGKASKRDRDEGCDGIAERKSELNSGGIGRKCSVEKRLANGDQVNAALLRNHHPTCKPTSLLRHLLRMITPPGATVIDPFFGSGSTGKAALLEGFNVIGMEREAEYFEIAQARCAYVAPEVMTVKPSSSESAKRQEKLF